MKSLQMSLFAPKRRRRVRPQRNVPHRVRGSLSRYVPVLVTVRLQRWLPSFRLQSLMKIFEQLMRALRMQGFRIVEYSVQDDHLHLLCEADDKQALGRGMKVFTLKLNKRINAALRRKRGSIS